MDKHDTVKAQANFFMAFTLCEQFATEDSRRSLSELRRRAYNQRACRKVALGSPAAQAAGEKYPPNLIWIMPAKEAG
jgi:hypothetical protein